jgi:ribonuclease T2
MLRLCRFALTAAFCAFAWTATAQQAALPGQFDYFLLTLTWSPAYCALHHGKEARAECARRRGFVVHGLWPQRDNGTWPAFCRAVPPVPADRMARQLQIMPSARLVQHEWDKHGSCTTLTANAYFDATDRAFAALRIPERLTRPTHPFALPLVDAKRLFTDANPGLAPDMFALRCNHGNRVEELRICLDTDFRFRRCGKAQEDNCPVTVRFASVTATGG